MSELESNIDEHKTADSFCYRVFGRARVWKREITGTVLGKVRQKPATVGNSQSVKIHLHEKTQLEKPYHEGTISLLHTIGYQIKHPAPGIGYLILIYCSLGSQTTVIGLITFQNLRTRP